MRDSIIASLDKSILCSMLSGSVLGGAIGNISYPVQTQQALVYAEKSNQDEAPGKFSQLPRTLGGGLIGFYVASLLACQYRAFQKPKEEL